MSKHTAMPDQPELTLKQLQGDCARMAPHWTAAHEARPQPVSPASIHGVVVPGTSARLLDAMSDYGD
ncbi:hypothetical protein RCO28_02850 [Streptomyces sp. LHD-70]|uniref:hypothetical protein n=1 Tax=Streptomyces sp. LHD-70 TaxID=3072140 RepID=UPI00280D8D38|nr:hypothetical protein [Streptomyces sp. LHD-70]MDQ8701429.1 hypothetical protein [Streptomyces sp. LHD-70]